MSGSSKYYVIRDISPFEKINDLNVFELLLTPTLDFNSERIV